MRVSVFGLGYVGCVTAACLAEAGHRVVGVDINQEKVSMVNAGTSPLVEPGLGELLADVTRAGRLRATTSAHEAVSESDLALICVGTPSRETGQLDVTAVQRVAEGIVRARGHLLRPYTVVLRSTVLPGTTASVLLPALRGTAAAERLAVAGHRPGEEFECDQPAQLQVSGLIDDAHATITYFRQDLVM